MSRKTIRLSVGAALMGVFLSSSVALAEDVIKIGIPVGLSGANSVVAPSVVQSAELAAEEINAKGGILGKKVVLEVADDGSGAAGAQKAFDSLIFQKKVNVLISMETSAARNAGLPIVTRGKTPFIYTSFYEGRSCNKYLYVNAWVPDQQVAPIVDYFAKNYKAKTFFLIGSDYAFGRGMLEFTRGYIEKTGGKVLGEEYLPMDGSDWTSIISKLKSSGADALITSTAGGAPNVTLTKQLRAAGVKIPYGNLAVDEGTAKSMGPDAEGIFISGSYFTNIDSPKNKAIPGGDAEEIRRWPEDTERLVRAPVRRRLCLQAGGGKGRFDRCRQGHRGAVAGFLRGAARRDQDEQAAPRAADHVPGPGAEGRQCEDARHLQERRSRRAVPEAEVRQGLGVRGLGDQRRVISFRSDAPVPGIP